YWEDYDLAQHQDRGEWQRQRRAYDAAYETTTDLANSVLTPSKLHWQDDDVEGHKAAAWPGAHGLLIFSRLPLMCSSEWRLISGLPAALKMRFIRPRR